MLISDDLDKYQSSEIDPQFVAQNDYSSVDLGASGDLHLRLALSACDFDCLSTNEILIMKSKSQL